MSAQASYPIGDDLMNPPFIVYGLSRTEKLLRIWDKFGRKINQKVINAMATQTNATVCDIEHFLIGANANLNGYYLKVDIDRNTGQLQMFSEVV